MKMKATDRCSDNEMIEWSKALTLKQSERYSKMTESTKSLYYNDDKYLNYFSMYRGATG